MKKKFAPIILLSSIIFLILAYSLILVAGFEKPFGKLESFGYLFEIIAVSLMIHYHVNRTGWIFAISGFIIILLIKAYSLYYRGLILNN